MDSMWRLARSGASYRATIGAVAIATAVTLSQAFACTSVPSVALCVFLPLAIVVNRCIPPLVVFMAPSCGESGRLVLRFTAQVAPLRLVHMLSRDSLSWPARMLAFGQSLRQTAEHAWIPVLEHLLSLAPIAVFDARVETPHVLTEALFTVPTLGPTRKFILIASGGEGRVFEQIRPGALRRSGTDLVTIDQLLDRLRGIGWRVMLHGPAAYAPRCDLSAKLPLANHHCAVCDAATAATFDMAIALASRSSVVCIPVEQSDSCSIVAWQCVRCGKTYCAGCANSDCEGKDQGAIDRITIDLKCTCGSLDFQPGFTWRS